MTGSISGCTPSSPRMHTLICLAINVLLFLSLTRAMFSSLSWLLLSAIVDVSLAHRSASSAGVVEGVPVQAEETIRRNPRRQAFCHKFAHVWRFFCESKTLPPPPSISSSGDILLTFFPLFLRDLLHHVAISSMPLLFFPVFFLCPASHGCRSGKRRRQRQSSGATAGAEQREQEHHENCEEQEGRTGRLLDGEREREKAISRLLPAPNRFVLSFTSIFGSYVLCRRRFFYRR